MFLKIMEGELSHHPLFHIALPSFSDRVDTATVALPVDIMLLRIFDRFLESSFLAKWDIEEFYTEFLCIFVSHREEFFEIFFR